MGKTPLLGLPLLLIFAGCLARTDSLFPLPSWKSTVLLDTGRKLQSVAVGELVGGKECAEIVALSEEGDGFCLAKSAGEWKSEKIIGGKGKLTGIEIADIDPGVPGNELYVGGEGVIFSLHRSIDGVWDIRKIWEGPAFVHGIASGDIDPRFAGNELAAVDYKGNVHCIRSEGDRWTSEIVFTDSDKLKDVAVRDFLALNKGDEIVCVGLSGKATLIWFDGAKWQHQAVWDGGRSNAGVGVNRIDAGEIVPGHGLDIILGCDSGEIVMIHRKIGHPSQIDEEAAGWVQRRLFTDTDKIRGVALADLDDASPGNEVAIFGYSKEIKLLTFEGDRISATLIGKDSDKGHWLASGELVGPNRTAELVTVGYSGKVTLFWKEFSPK